MKIISMTNKSREVIAVTMSLVLAAVIILTGTFAWRSISQEAKNEVMAKTANVGGRLHDDFDGSNKDIYVENFGDQDAAPIFARIRLDEYMELGEDAGVNLTAPDRKAAPLVNGSDIKDVTTWTTHIPDKTAEECTNGAPNTFHEYWTWEMGGQTVFMPTFNKNKDSLKADINGTYAGENGTPYDDYKVYTNGETKTDEAVYDDDTNDIDDDNVVTKTEIHTAKETLNATVVTMEEWINAGRKTGRFWVYDKDGWAYWAEAIQPGEATGLLLTGITQEMEPIENWYYAINVVAQFATAGDWGDEAKGTGFFDTTKGSIPTDDAMFLLTQAAGEAPKVTIMAAGDATSINKGNTLQFSAELTRAGIPITNQKVTWAVKNATSLGTSISADGLLTVGADETAAELIVEAVSDEDKGTEIYKVTVNP